MKKNYFLIKVICIFSLFFSNAIGKEKNYLNEGIKLFKKDKFEESKILFERDIVFNPKSEKSYLYLAKIFNKDENDNLEEINLSSVLLLNPQNDEALYMLILLKIKSFDYEKARNLIDRFNLVCNSFCSKKNEIEKKLEKIIPEDEKNIN